MRIGFIGLGMVGRTTYDWIKENTEHQLSVVDPAYGASGGLQDCDAIFISVPVDTNKDGTQDLENLYDAMDKCEMAKNAHIFIRSTVLPGTCQQLSLMYGRDVWSMPEFLSEATCKEDFEKNDIVTGCPDFQLLRDIFNDRKHFIQVTNREAEFGKYVHNVFAAVKIHFFNKIYEFCEASTDMDYKNVRDIALVSDYINPMHTMVPGPDGQRGFGGKCLPKDLKAYAFKIEDKILKSIYHENAMMREEGLQTPETFEASDTCCGGGCGSSQ